MACDGKQLFPSMADDDDVPPCAGDDGPLNRTNNGFKVALFFVRPSLAGSVSFFFCRLPLTCREGQENRAGGACTILSADCSYRLLVQQRGLEEGAKELMNCHSFVPIDQQPLICSSMRFISAHSS